MTATALVATTLLARLATSLAGTMTTASALQVAALVVVTTITPLAHLETIATAHQAALEVMTPMALETLPVA